MNYLQVRFGPDELDQLCELVSFQVFLRSVLLIMIFRSLPISEVEVFFNRITTKHVTVMEEMTAIN